MGEAKRVAEGGRAPVYGQPSDPVTLARWAGQPSIAFGAPDPPAVPQSFNLDGTPQT